MKTRELVLAGILLALGLTLHAVTPALLGNVKPDFLLATMFIAILFQPYLKNTIMIGFVAGVMAAMTTGFPGGQLPSVFDKIISALFVLALIKLFSVQMNLIKVSILGFLGTIVSGIVFLGSALLMVGLPAPFTALFMVVVLPTALANTALTLVLYKTAQLVMKGAKIRKVSLT